SKTVTGPRERFNRCRGDTSLPALCQASRAAARGSAGTSPTPATCHLAGHARRSPADEQRRVPPAPGRHAHRLALAGPGPFPAAVALPRRRRPLAHRRPRPLLRPEGGRPRRVLWAALLLQPVGVDQPRRIVVGVLVAVGEEGVLVVHDSLWGA